MLALLLLWCGCSQEQQDRQRRSRGGKLYGGVFNVNEANEVGSLFPLSMTKAAAHRVASQVYEGLVALDPQDLTIVPRLAERWDVTNSSSVFTFYLREGIRFHDDPCFKDGEGRELTAHDVKYCFDQLCTTSPDNQMFWLFQDKVLGANDHFQASRSSLPEGGVRGVTVVDDLTIRIELTSPSPAFLSVIAHQGCWIYPRELRETKGLDPDHHLVGTGPFKVKTYSPREAMIMERWKDYWGMDVHGNRLPFLDAVKFTFVNDGKAELEQFLAGNLTLMKDVPVRSLFVLQDTIDASGQLRFSVQSAPSLSVQFYGFQVNKPPFDDPAVRKAFSMAIDKQQLVDSVLQGMGVSAEHGLVPPSFSGYPYALVGSYGYDPAEARLSLAEAGYPGGEGFPHLVLQVSSGGFGYVEVGEAVQSMLKEVLNIDLSIAVLPADQHFDRIETGNALFWREGWLADHPDPENFLALLYGQNAPDDPTERTYLNTTRFQDAKFDSLFFEAAHNGDASERLHLFGLAEAHAMQQAPLIPLYYARTVRLLQPWVRDLPLNGMEYLDLSKVWFSER